MLESPENQQRLYGDLAWVWPIISPPEDYVEETEGFCQIIRENSHIQVNTILHLGCGGGHNDHTLHKHYKVTGVDISEAMLSLARKLNPQVTYHVGDMRMVRLDKTFDAVISLDSIGYMLTEEDLQSAFITAYHHLKPGGVFLTLAEETPQQLQKNRLFCSTHSRGDIEIDFVQNYYDPDPSDSTFQSVFVFLIHRGHRLEIETDRHLGGIFEVETWHRLLKEAGFEVRQMEFRHPALEGDSCPMFVCIRPL